MGDVKINIELGVKIDQPGNTFAPFARIHLGSAIDVYTIASSDYTDLVADSSNPSAFATTASAALDWYDDLSDNVSGLSAAQNETNAKNRLRLGFSKLKTWTP